jgi:release factor glutamine methyltransferase
MSQDRLGLPPDGSGGPRPVRSAVAEAARLLAAAGVPTPRVDAEVLAAQALGVRRGALALRDRFTPAQAVEYDRLVRERARRIPLQHLVESAPFRMMDLAVGPGVFIPRPETELLVDWGLTVLTAGPAAPLVVDLCAGSGAIALAVAHERPGSRVYAVERARGALVWLRRNARLRVAAGDPRIRVVEGDVGDPAILSTLDGTVDLVLCNPPYVPESVAVPPEVAEHDPAEAVFAGPDGLAVIRTVVARAATLLRPGGWLGIEHDDTHGEAVPALLAAHGRYRDVADHRDLARRPRFATARMAD